MHAKKGLHMKFYPLKFEAKISRTGIISMKKSIKSVIENLQSFWKRSVSWINAKIVKNARNASEGNKIVSKEMKLFRVNLKTNAACFFTKIFKFCFSYITWSIDYSHYNFSIPITIFIIICWKLIWKVLWGFAICKWILERYYLHFVHF